MKSHFVTSRDGADEIAITAHSYAIESRVEVVLVLGGDGHMHGVPVPWDEYIPLEARNTFLVARAEQVGDRKVIARRNGLCIYQ